MCHIGCGISHIGFDMCVMLDVTCIILDVMLDVMCHVGLDHVDVTCVILDVACWHDVTCVILTSDVTCWMWCVSCLM